VSISHIGTTQASEGASTSISIAAPEDLQDRDVLYAVLTRNDSEAGAWVTVPPGWTALVGELSVGGTPITISAISIFRRYVRTVADQGATYLWTCDDSEIVAGYLVGLRGVAIRAEDETIATAAQGEGTPTTPTLWDIPVGWWLLSAALKDDDGAITAVPTGYTQRGSIIEQVGTGGQSLAVGTKEVVSGGDQAPLSFSAPSDPWAVVTLALVPEVVI
jgi:hypothetical protein